MILRSIQVGVPRSYGSEGAEDSLDRPWTSAIAKQPISGAVWVGRLGVAGDMQADRRVHGGPEKAVLAYGYAHYARWKELLGRADVGPGWFGENLTIAGLEERTACIGDRLAIGQARLEVTQPRQPCATLNRRFHRKDMVKLVQAHHRTGWYLRVLTEGWVEAGMEVTLADRPYPQWPVFEASVLMVERAQRREEAARLAACPALSQSWRGTLSAAAPAA
ncbi:MAG TPA: MOSC domain-containing protein [Gemmatimonadales bacterium]|nr:MOSC domain-containing protein [Gemmatimonadales bacterium]